MKTRPRLLIASTLVLVVLIALTPSVMQFLGQELVNRLHERGVRVRVDGLAGGRVGISAEAIEGWVSLPLGGKNKAFPVSYKLDNASAYVRIPLLSPWAPSIKFNANSYGGKIEGFAPLISSIRGTPTLDLVLRRVDLAQHPQARAFGVEAGTIDLELQQHPMSGLPFNQARYMLDVLNLSVELPPMVAQIAKISSVSDGAISARAVMQSSGAFSVDPCNVKSSLGSIALKAHGMWSGSALKDLWGDLRVDLDTEQGASIRPWLGLLVPAARMPAQGPVRCEFRGGACSVATATQLRLGTLCIRLDCGA